MQHLSSDQQSRGLEEISRILKPDGGAYASFGYGAEHDNYNKADYSFRLLIKKGDFEEFKKKFGGFGQLQTDGMLTFVNQLIYLKHLKFKP